MFYYIYVLKSIKEDEIYVGYIIDLKKGFEEHNRGHNISTKAIQTLDSYSL